VLFASALVAASIGLAGANPANAETGIWHQSFERASQEAECEPPSDETPWQTSFSGGWVCQRHIIWADVASYPSAGCILTVSFLFDYYADFQGGFSWEAGRELYADSSCETLSVASFGDPMVYAPAGFDADSLCRQAFGTGVDTSSGTGVSDTYFCQ